jgi:hypothetical protein
MLWILDCDAVGHGRLRWDAAINVTVYGCHRQNTAVLRDGFCCIWQRDFSVYDAVSIRPYYNPYRTGDLLPVYGRKYSVYGRFRQCKRPFTAVVMVGLGTFDSVPIEYVFIFHRIGVVFSG